MAYSAPRLIATGTVRAFRCVKLVSGTDNGGIEANANEIVAGIADGSVEDPLISTAVHATANNEIRLQDGSDIFVECGGVVAVGDRLKPDADGKAVALATSGTTEQEYFGRALQVGADTRVIRIQWAPGTMRPALT